MQFLFICRSLTYAQRAARLLERAGITGTVARVPKNVETRGCAYCVIVMPRNKERALEVLRSAGRMPERIFLRETGGQVREVAM